MAYASKTLNMSQRQYCTTNKELLAVVTAVQLIKYYLTFGHFMMVTDHASLTWFCNFKEPVGVIACWITGILTSCTSLANTITILTGCLCKSMQT